MSRDPRVNKVFLGLRGLRASRALSQDPKVDQAATVPLEQLLRSQAPVVSAANADLRVNQYVDPRVSAASQV